MAYVARYGADYGGGYNDVGAVDTLIPGHYIGGGDVYGFRFTTDGGNSWWGCNQGFTSSQHTRACYVSKRPATSGLGFFGTGSLRAVDTNGGGALYGLDLGSYAWTMIDQTNGFGNKGFGAGAGNTASNTAKRPSGDMIDGVVVGGTEYVYTVTTSGVNRYTNAGANAAAVSGPTLVASPTQINVSNCNFFTTLRVIDRDNIIVLSYDRNGGGGSAFPATQPVRMFLLQPNTGHLDTVTSTSQVTVTTLTHPVNHIYDLKIGKDGNMYAACGFDGVYRFQLSGTTPTWTFLFAGDNVVSSVDADSTGRVWAGQAGGSGDYVNDTTMASGHGAIRSAASHAAPWTYPGGVAGAVSPKVFKPGDAAQATGGTWWLSTDPHMFDQNAYDCSLIRVDPFDDNKIALYGRSGTWQTRDGGGHFYPAMQGFNGSEVNHVYTYPATPTKVATDDVDYKGKTSNDLMVTATKAAAPVAGSGKTTGAGATTIIGDDGQTYVFTAPSGSGGAALTRNGTPIATGVEYARFKGAICHPTSIAVSKNGTVFIGQFGGGTFVMDPTGGGPPPPPAPTISSFTPATSAVAGTVTVNGANFTGATSVLVNGTAAVSFTVVSSIKITFVVPSGATTGPIRVVSPNGFGDSATSLVVGTPAAPTITSFTPTTQAPGGTVTVTGTNFSGATVVKVGTLSASFTVASSTTITLTVPTGAVSGKITVTTPGGTVVSSGTLTVSAGVSAPTITSFTPTTGLVGDTITVTGTNFTNASSVKVNTTSASFTVASSTTITLTIPNASTTGKITVTTPGGTVVSSGTLTVSAGGGGTSPFVRVIDSQAPVGAGTTVTLTIPTGGVPVGHTVIVGACSNTSAVTGITDSRSNTYTADVTGPVINIEASLWSAPVTTALQSGDTITITYAGSISGRNGVAAEYQYLVAPANDSGVTGTASSAAFTNTSASKSVAVATSQANELVVSLMCVGASGTSAGTVSATGALTKRVSVENASGTTRSTSLGDRNLTSVLNPVATAWSWTNANAYALLQTAYKVTPPGGGGSGVAPTILQSVSLGQLQTASTATFTNWANATRAGSRIVVIVGITDNGHNGIGVTVSGGGTYQLGANTSTRVVSGLNQDSVRVFHLLNAPAAVTSPTITFTGLPGAGVYVWAIGLEVAGSHPTIIEDSSDTDPQAKKSGNGQSIALGPVGPTTRDGVLWFAAFHASNIDAVTLATGSTFTTYAQANSSSAGSDPSKWSYQVARKSQTLAGAAESVTANIAGGTNHDYASVMVAIPSPDSGGGGGGGGTGVLPDTNDGTGHFSRTGQYFPAITSGSGRTAIQNAQWIAGRCDIVIENVSENAGGVISADKYSGLTAAMVSTNPDIILSVYAKGPEIDEGAAFFPNTYYAHQVPWPSGAQIATGFSPNILRAQPYSPDQPNFTDPRGFTASSFRDYRAKDAQHTLNTYNTLHPTGTLNSWFHDSSGAAAYSTLIADPLNPTQTYQAAYPDGRTAYLDLVDTIPDTTIATLGTGYIVIVNGLGSGVGYYNNLNRLLSHCHVGYAEVWLKQNFVTFANAWPLETDWQQSVDMLVHANEVLGKGVICATNIANNTSGSPPSGWVDWTQPQIDQGRRFCFASYMLGKRGASWFEYVPTAPTGDYLEDDPWYHVNLGAPLDNPPVDASGHGAATAMKTGAVYQRRFTFGSVYVNPTTATVSFVLDQDYYQVAADGSASATLYGAAGSTQTLPAHDAVIVYTGPSVVTNTGPPVGTIIAPPTTVSTPDVVLKATYTDPDNDSIASAQARNFTNTTTWTPMTQAGGVWSAPITLTAGANVLQTRATDGNVAPQTSSPIQRTVTYTAVTPSAPVNSTPPIVPVDLIAGVPFSVNPGTWTNSPTTYTYTLKRRPAAGGTFVTVQTDTAGQYTPTAGDVNYVFLVSVVASNGASSSSVDSNVSNPVQPAVNVTLQVVEE